MYFDSRRSTVHGGQTWDGGYQSTAGGGCGNARPDARRERRRCGHSQRRGAKRSGACVHRGWRGHVRPGLEQPGEVGPGDQWQREIGLRWARLSILWRPRVTGPCLRAGSIRSRSLERYTVGKPCWKSAALCPCPRFWNPRSNTLTKDFPCRTSSRFSGPDKRRSWAACPRDRRCC